MERTSSQYSKTSIRVSKTILYNSLRGSRTGRLRSLLHQWGRRAIRRKDTEAPRVQNFSQSLVHFLIQAVSFTLAVTRLLKQHAKEAVASVSKLRQNVSSKISDKEQAIRPPPLISSSLYSSKTYIDRIRKTNWQSFLTSSFRVLFLLKMGLRPKICRL